MPAKKAKIVSGSIMPYTVISDTREQKGWTFSENQYCAGTIIKGLKTGDYSIVGCETVFTIERKRNVAEFAGNIIQARFENEMKRLEFFPDAYLILEFTMENLMQWPVGSGLPPYLQRKTKISKRFLMKRFMDFQTNYRTKIILAGAHGKDVASSLFKRMSEKYAIKI
jgi:hypothetical protein